MRWLRGRLRLVRRLLNGLPGMKERLAIVTEQLSVLVVERNAAVRDALTTVLQGRGYLVEAVSSRAEGFDVLDELGPDLLILDDPGTERSYRLIWLKEVDQPDVRVELFDLQPGALTEQFEGLLPRRSSA